MRAMSLTPVVSLLFLLGCTVADGPATRVETWTLREDLRIGAVDDPVLSLTAVGAVEVDRNGRLYVTQEMDGRVRTFGRDGTPLGSFGGRGEGPGEFQSLAGLAWVGDTLWVLDWQQHRFNLFTSDGAFVRVVKVETLAPTRGTLSMRIPGGLLSDGSVWAGESFPSGLIESGQVTQRALLHMAFDGAILDTIALIPMGHGTLTLKGENATTYANQPFSDAPTFAQLADSAFLVVDREVREKEPHFTLTKLGLAGDTIWQRSYRYQPLALHKAEVDSVVATLAKRFDGVPGVGSGRPAQARIREALYVPAHRTPIRAVLGARDGSIWLEVTDPSPSTSRWLVLDRDGDREAEVWLPSRTIPRWVGPDAVWAVYRDELDVPYLVRYRIDRGASSDAS